MRQYRLEQMGATAPMRLVPGNGRHLTFPCRSKNQSLGNSSSASFYFEDRPEVPTAIEMNSREQQVDYLRRLAYESKDQSIVAQMLTDIVERKMALKN